MATVTRTSKTILLIDDDPHMHTVCRRFLEKAGFRFLAASDANRGLEWIKSGGVDLVLLDFMMPQLDGYHVYKRLAASPEFEHVRGIPVIMLTVLKEDHPKRLELMQMGLTLWLRKPFGQHELVNIIDNVFVVAELRRQAEEEMRRARETAQRAVDENAYLRSQLKEAASLDNMIASDEAMQQVVDRIRRVAPTEASVLIFGEKGTGKELMARAIHALSKRAESPFIAVDCVTLPGSFLESELFGYEGGLFGGTTQSKPGLLELAQEGTLFLDGITELGLDLQAKLLRALQEGRFRRVGGREPIQADFRVIAAASCNPEQAVIDGKLRQDLYYRLNVVPIELPPLRKRRDDIPLLIQHFLRKYSEKNQCQVMHVAPEALKLLVRYDWPGNVRELQGVIERMASLATGNQLDLADVPEPIKSACETGLPAEYTGLPLAEARRKWLEQFEKKYLLDLLSKCNGNVSRMAQVAGVNRMTIYRRLKSYNIAFRAREPK